MSERSRAELHRGTRRLGPMRPDAGRFGVSATRTKPRALDRRPHSQRHLATPPPRRRVARAHGDQPRASRRTHGSLRPRCGCSPAAGAADPSSEPGRASAVAPVARLPDVPEHRRATGRSATARVITSATARPCSPQTRRARFACCATAQQRRRRTTSSLSSTVAATRCPTFSRPAPPATPASRTAAAPRSSVRAPSSADARGRVRETGSWPPAVRPSELALSDRPKRGTSRS